MKITTSILIFFIISNIQAQNIKIDTIIKYGNHRVSIKKVHSDLTQEKTAFEKEIEPILAKEGNMHRKSILKENYLIEKHKNLARKEEGKLYLKIDTGEWKLIKINPEADEVENTLDKIDLNKNFYIVRTQWGEGNAYKLVNKLNGNVTDTFGEPCINGIGNLIVSYNVDLVAGYSENGFEFFSKQNIIEYIGKYKPNDWGAEWGISTSENTFIFKCYSLDFQLKQNHFFIEIEIN